MSVLVQLEWSYVDMQLRDEELLILRLEYERYKRIIEAGLRR